MMSCHRNELSSSDPSSGELSGLALAYAECFTPNESTAVEFWTRGMAERFKAGCGIPGIFKEGRFWSADGADHWSLSEVVAWISTARRPLRDGSMLSQIDGFFSKGPQGRTALSAARSGWSAEEELPRCERRARATRFSKCSETHGAGETS